MEENKNQRLLLTVALCMGVALAWSYLFNPAKNRPHPTPAAVEQAKAPQAGSGSAAAAVAAGSGSAAAAPAAGDVSRGTPGAPEAKKFPTRLATLENDKIKAVVTSDGAALLHLVLKGDKYKRQVGSMHAAASGPQPQVDLAQIDAGQLPPLSTTLKAGDAAGAGAPLVAAEASYDLVSSDVHQAVFKAEVAGVTVQKTFTVDPDGYKLALAVEVGSAAALNGTLAVSWDAKTLPAGQGGGGWFSSRTNLPAQSICEPAGGKPERLAPGAKKPEHDAPAASFAGIDEQYFLAAMLPAADAKAGCRITSDATGALRATVTLPVAVAAGGKAESTLKLFAGPKETDLLESVSTSLKDSVDLGFWWVIARVLLGAMKFFYKLVPNWGVAIILLTLAVKAITFPLQHKSMKSMQEMQRIQPQLDELKKKYAGDQQKQNLEQMKLFKEHGVNPMGSCLPMVIQMPIWIALYTTLQVSVELYHSTFIPGWLVDLTAKDPYYVLPVLMGITMFLTQILTPSPMSQPGQKVMGYAMTAFFSFLMLNLPSGLTLYIFVNNILSIIQQIYLRRTMRPPGPPAMAAANATVAVSAKRG